MKRFGFLKTVVAPAIIAAAMLPGGCAKVPLTGRTQMALLPESMLVEMSLTNYDDFLKGNKLSSNKEQSDMVKRVGSRISKAVEKYLSDNGMASRTADFKWEFNLIENETPNAWAMPGGKVVFYTGILPLTQSEAGIAVVMGHEIAHAVARHGNERMSQALLLQMGGIALSEALQTQPETTRALFLGAYGAGAQVGIMLPYSRKHEYEADELGLYFMAMAGYHPSEAVDFWTRMSQYGGANIPEFLSTHPVEANRIDRINRLLPKAMEYYQAGLN
jgi:predicted Zn-dependent protease